MQLQCDLPKRKHLRFKGYDYSRRGVYFVTICTHARRNLLSTITNGKIILHGTGEIVSATWLKLPERFPDIILDDFVLMPNHLHAVLGLVGAGLAPPDIQSRHTLSEVICAFKSISTLAVNRHLWRKGIPLWQRSFYERVVRSGEELKKIQQYVAENPLIWSLDPENLAGNA